MLLLVERHGPELLVIYEAVQIGNDTTLNKPWNSLRLVKLKHLRCGSAQAQDASRILVKCVRNPTSDFLHSRQLPRKSFRNADFDLEFIVDPLKARLLG